MARSCGLAIGLMVAILAGAWFGHAQSQEPNPGEMRYFQLSHIPSPQIKDRPFPLTITAMDALNNPVTNYQEIVQVTAYARTNFNSTVIYTTNISNFVNGVWSGYYSIPVAATNVNLVAWDPLPGRAGASSTFEVRATPNLFVNVISNAVEGGGLIAGAGVVSIARPDSIDLVVNFGASDSDIGVPDSITIPVGQTSAVFSITILDDTRLDGSQPATVMASSMGYFSGSATLIIHDNESTSLHVSLPDLLREGAVAGQASVSIDSPAEADVVVQLHASDTTEVALLPATVTIPSGQNEAAFTVYIFDDNLVDGAQLVSVTASVSNWVSGLASTMVQDNESTNLTVSFTLANSSPMEGGGGVSIQVRLGGLAASNIVIGLASSDMTELIVPPALLILAGRQTGTTNVVFPDDTEFDGSQTVTATAAAPGFNDGMRDVTVLDNDIHHFLFNPIGNQTSDVPFQITLTPMDVNGVTIQTFGQVFQLSAHGPQGPIPITPNSTAGFVRGQGAVTLWQPDTNIFLTVTAANGTSGQSNPFNVAGPIWGTVGRIFRIEKDGDDARLTFRTVLGRKYRLEFASNLPVTSWVPVLAPTNGTGTNVTLIHPNGILQRQGFYRLRIAH